MKQFDDKFGEKLGEAFSNYNADDLADEGWNSFLAKRKEKKRHEAFVFFRGWGKAAAIGILIGLGALIIYMSINHTSSGDYVSGLTESGSVKDTSSALMQGIILPVIQQDKKSELHPESIATLRQSDGSHLSDNFNKPDTEKIYISEITDLETGTTTSPDTDKNLISLDHDTLKTVDKKLEKPLEEVPGQTGSAPPEVRSGKTKLLAGMSGMMAHVDGAETSTPGLSVGFFLEHKISRRFSFRPGLAVAMNSLGISSSRSSTAFAYANSVVNGINGTPESFKGQFSVVSMEVPLNIVFRLVERKSSSVYLSAGASTVFYLSEHFTGEYVNKTSQIKTDAVTGMTHIETKYSSISVEDEYSAFSRTDYFGLANISAGYSLPFAKTSMLRIEPFIQLPLNDLTSLDLHVYYTGISMKVSLGNNSH